ncbi:MAG: ATP-binding protein, partial [Bryobacteraceae bacterium]
QNRFHLADDGVTWQDRIQKNGSVRVEAEYVVPGGPAERAGIQAGDILISISGYNISDSSEATQVLTRVGSWKKTEYKVWRPQGNSGVEIQANNVIVGEVQPDTALWAQYAAGAAYLAIGLFVFFRRGGAPKAVHFYLLCLISFILSCFHYSGKLNNFDKVIYWGNVAAGFVAPTLFLHFCLSFPQPRKWLRGWRAVVLYLPAIGLLAVWAGIATGTLRLGGTLLEVRMLLDRVQMAFLSSAYILGAAALTMIVRREDDPVVRRQLTWLRNGALAGVLPFTVFYVLPYVFGAVPTHLMKLSVLTLPLMPLMWAYAILRYRLMDVDIIFQQGLVYTMATLSVLAIFFGVLFSLGKVGELTGTALVMLLLIAVFIFQPIRNWLQELLDRHYFYKDRYDYRRTLIEFARELGAETDLDKMLESVADRMVRTLKIRAVAAFLWDESQSGFVMRMASDRQGRFDNLPEDLDLSFLSNKPEKPYLFFERTRNLLDVVSKDWPTGVRNTIAELELTYYIPCSARGRTIAYLGVSRTDDGDFLSSDDLELVQTLAGYVGIAIENANLYSSLARKVEEFERLKEFSENIVESINVGILAVDLEDRVESWNTQIERLTGIARHAAIGRVLTDLFPADLCERFASVRGETGVHNIYKFVLKQPQETTVNLAVAPLVSKEGEQIGRLIIFDDVTDRAELERRLVQADKLSSIGLLAAGVAHEVNTPLAVISNYAQMLAKQVSGDEAKSKLLDKIARSTFRASEIVNSLLNFSRTSPNEFVDLDLNKVVRETVTLVEHQLTKAHVAVALKLDASLPAVKGSPGKLQQVFLNLILNARDAMDAGGELTLRTWSNSITAHLEVSDTGAGIPSENLQRIFDPFFTTKGAKKGTGLGLSVSYGIIREHGGEIEVESASGQGTCFRLSFPIARRSAQIRQSPIAELANGRALPVGAAASANGNSNVPASAEEASPAQLLT